MLLSTGQMRTSISSPRKHFRTSGGIKVEEHDMTTSSNRPTQGTAKTEVLGLSATRRRKTRISTSTTTPTS